MLSRNSGMTTLQIHEQITAAILGSLESEEMRGVIMSTERFDFMYEREGCDRISGNIVECASLNQCFLGGVFSGGREVLLCTICHNDLSVQVDSPGDVGLGIGLFSYAVAPIIDRLRNGALACFQLEALRRG
ncbi:hypothetical protein SARC_02810 [Sphaeroforma arctica JP610]|uniref:Uncharacterized protein n=1 Tax=Sphaeroforma arctica JP610 TaxID=667725 RepID=A0A0L0G7L5_9EUKA|nr:hypothetical protein SARC_02810 [Sphaeroforma arctica JP610]KNC84990.1 hypothetical protein SARC_02810 [Sphaeroforma arctica JP610]|eukprot:XP_014158892.1 hypothetical protein SARC_02810 [Sphaeroforma arctica JP610]